MPLRVSAEDVGPLLAALEMVTEQIELDLEPDYGIQVAANRVVWKDDMGIAAAELRNAERHRRMQGSLMVEVPLSPAVASSCGAACIVAANRLDHYSGIVSESAKGGIRAALVAQGADQPTRELVQRHFSWVRDDAAWARQEALRLRLHAHELMLHQAD